MGIKAPYPLRVPMIQGSVGFGLGGLERLLKGFMVLLWVLWRFCRGF